MQTLAPPPSPIPRQWAKSKGNCSPPPQPKPTPRSTQCLDVLHRGRLASAARLPGASGRRDPSDGDVAAFQQQPVVGMGLWGEEASTQDDHRLFWRHEGRTLSLCAPLPSGPPTHPPTRFVNWPFSGLPSPPKGVTDDAELWNMLSVISPPGLMHAPRVLRGSPAPVREDRLHAALSGLQLRFLQVAG